MLITGVAAVLGLHVHLSGARQQVVECRRALLSLGAEVKVASRFEWLPYYGGAFDYIEAVRLPETNEGLERRLDGRIDEAMELIAECTRLRELCVRARWSDFDDRCLEHLTGLKSLRKLDVALTEISDEGMRFIAELKGLEVLKLDTNGVEISDEGLTELAALTELRNVTLGTTAVTDEGLGTIARWTKLEELDLSWTGVTNAGVTKLAPLTRLRRLNLTGTEVDDGVVKDLLEMRALTDLELAYTKVTLSTLDAFLSMPCLRTLVVSNTPLAQAAKAQGIRPNGEIKVVIE